MPEQDSVIAAVGAAILRYLARHPQAADTIDGIGQWWLGDLRVRPTDELLRAALDSLVERGQIARSHLPDGTILYAKRRGAGTDR